MGSRGRVGTLLNVGIGPRGFTGPTGVTGPRGPAGLSANVKLPCDVVPFVTVKKRSAGPSSFAEKLIGSGTTISSDTSLGGTEMSIGSLAKKPGRIYTAGRKFMTAGQQIYLNGINTPYHLFNEFGSDLYDHDWWDAEFTRLNSLGINSVRVWVNDDPTLPGPYVNGNLGIWMDQNYAVNVSAKWWQDVDDIVALAATHKIYIRLVVFTMHFFDWNFPLDSTHGSWSVAFGSLVGVQSFVDTVIVPLATRYEDNIYFWSIDLGNEIDTWLEHDNYNNPPGGIITPNGSGSSVYVSNYRLSDYLVGQILYIGGQIYGTISLRIDDFTFQAGSYSGDSEPLSNCAIATTDGGVPPQTIQRYLAYAAKAVHRSGSPVLLTFGMESIKHGSTAYSGDFWSDTILASFTNDAESFLDFYQVHWYSWGARYFPFLIDVVSQGLPSKPAILGEFSANAIDTNIPNVSAWTPGTWFGPGQFVFLNGGFYLSKPLWESGVVYAPGAKVVSYDPSAPQYYRSYQTSGGGTSGATSPTGTGTISDGAVTWTYLADLGNSGWDLGPTGTGSWIEEGQTVWAYVGTTTWTTSTVYNDYSMVIANGNIYVVDYGNHGTSGSNPPSGTTSPVTDGTVKWTYRGPMNTSLDYVFNTLLSGGWAGHHPWSSNAVDDNGGAYYYTTKAGMRSYPDSWSSSTGYYPGDSCVNDGNKFYRMIGVSSGTSAPSGSGPTGTGASISDGTLTWKYEQTLPNPPWTDCGTSAIAFAAANHLLVFPDITGPSDNSGTVTMQSKYRTIYEPGTTMIISASFQFSTGTVDGSVQRVGWFDDTDGIFFQRDSGVDSIVIRSYGVDTVITRDQWNVNSLLGTDGSGIIFDPTNYSGIEIAVDWSGGGLATVGFLINGTTYWAHDITRNLMPSTPCLPIRWEIWSLAGSDLPAVDTMISYDGYASRVKVSGDQIPGVSWNGGSTVTVYGNSQTATALTLRVKNTATKYATLRPTKLSIIDSAGEGFSGRLYWELTYNAGFTYTGTWNSESAVAESVPGISLTDAGTVVMRGVWESGAHFEETLEGMPWLGADCDGNSETVTLQITNTTGTTRYYWVVLSWEEKT